MNELIKSLEDKVYAHAQLDGRTDSVLKRYNEGLVSPENAFAEYQKIHHIKSQKNWAERVLKGEL